MRKLSPERGRKIALAIVDLVQKWLEFRSGKIDKLKVDYEFAYLHNSETNSQLYQIIGKVCRGSLHRWITKLDST